MRESVSDEPWQGVREALQGPGRLLRNITATALTRHVRGGAGDRRALCWRPRTGPVREYSYEDLDQAVSRFASGLAREGIGPGHTVAVLTGRVPELFVAVLGALRAGAAATVLFASFGPDPVRRRLARSRARLLVTTSRLYRDKVAPVRTELPSLQRVLLANRGVTAPHSGCSTAAVRAVR